MDPSQASERRALWLWLSLRTELAGKSRAALLKHFGGDLAALYGADSYSDIPGVASSAAERLRLKDMKLVDKTLENCRNEGITVITPDDPEYPERLKLISDPPGILYRKGKELPEADALCVAVVGTRRMSEYGRDCAYGTAYDLAKAGAVVVSGMAIGVDGTAHRACLDAGGLTVAVLGNGLDRAYPAAHGDLMAEIAERGTLLSEFPPYSHPEKWHFPSRNRIISGISQAVLIIEAPEKSGALNTAAHASDQHRRVYAMPGKAGELGNVGTNALIRDGAGMITEGREIIADFEERYPSVSSLLIPSEAIKPKAQAPKPKAPAKKEKPRQRAKKPEPPVPQPDVREEIPMPEVISAAPPAPRTIPEGLEGIEADIMGVFAARGGVMTADEISVRLGAEIGDVLFGLTMLEIKELITAVPGGKYVLV
ncbi:MAG: DNA-processing protein DprA [Clostridia bacterium]|nr:DNA-processing protein DprA [Clostridia bacterium]